MEASESSIDNSIVKKENVYLKNEKERTVTHQDALTIVQKSLTRVLRDDPLISDLSPQVTTDEVLLQIALEHGQAMTVNVVKADGQVVPVIVEQDAKVIDLKNAFRTATMLKIKREGGPSRISWKYLWKRYWLYFENQKLADDQRKVKEYGIRNRDQITFIKRLQSR